MKAPEVNAWKAIKSSYLPIGGYPEETPIVLGPDLDDDLLGLRVAYVPHRSARLRGLEGRKGAVGLGNTKRLGNVSIWTGLRSGHDASCLKGKSGSVWCVSRKYIRA